VPELVPLLDLAPQIELSEGLPKPRRDIEKEYSSRRKRAVVDRLE